MGAGRGLTCLLCTHLWLPGRGRSTPRPRPPFARGAVDQAGNGPAGPEVLSQGPHGQAKSLGSWVLDSARAAGPVTRADRCVGIQVQVPLPTRETVT